MKVQSRYCQWGANVDAGSMYSSALKTASRNGHEIVVALLLSNGANVEANEYPPHETALRATCDAGSENVVQLLLQNGASVNAKDQSHTTALHIASHRGYEKIVRILLGHGADAKIVSYVYGTVVEATSNPGYHKIVTQNFSEEESMVASRVGWEEPDPSGTLNQALRERDMNTVRVILANQFQLVAKEEYAWLQDLSELDYTTDDLAEILLEAVADRPWIFFDPREQEHNSAKVDVDAHLTKCSHRWDTTLQPSGEEFDTAVLPELLSETELRTSIEALCGLAGVIPILPDKTLRNGSVHFEKDFSCAYVSYAVYVACHSGYARDMASLHRTRQGLSNLCQAFGVAQAAQICCNFFTVMRLRDQSGASEELTRPFEYVELLQVDFHLALQFLDELDIFMANKYWVPEDFESCCALALHILEAIVPLDKLPSLPIGSDHDNGIHVCSLAVQFLSLAFFSYTQAHTKPFRPFFLDRSIDHIKLQGSFHGNIYSHQKHRSYPAIIASFFNLTCVGDMLRSPALVFRHISIDSYTLSEIGPPETKFDVLATMENILDTWGPGRFIVRNDQPLPCAISINGGTIYASDSAGRQFHWKRGSNADLRCDVPIKLQDKLIIGSFITVNDNCPTSEVISRQQAASILEPLGPYDSYWEFREKQIGVQGGQYLGGQYNQIRCKIPGKSLKVSRLEQNDEFLIPFLEHTWGLQLSICTSIARRVRLRELIADMLPVFADEIFSHDERWVNLCNHNLLDALHSPFHQEWLNWLKSLSDSLKPYVLSLIRLVLEVFQQTGVDRKDNNLVVAWPQHGDLLRGVKIPWQAYSLWTRILADGKHCATFAYMTPKCLESSTISCCGKGTPVWQNVSRQLATAVDCVTAVPTATIWTLENGKKYIIRTPESWLIVRTSSITAQELFH